MKLAFELPPAQAAKLREEAARLGLTPEAFATGCERGYIYVRGEYPTGDRAAVGRAGPSNPGEESGAVPAPRLMRYLSLGEIVDLHQALLNQTGNAAGIRDVAMLESALAQPRATFGGADFVSEAWVFDLVPGITHVSFFGPLLGFEEICSYLVTALKALIAHCLHLEVHISTKQPLPETVEARPAYDDSTDRRAAVRERRSGKTEAGSGRSYRKTCSRGTKRTTR